MKKTTILAVSLLLACSGSAFAGWDNGVYYINNKSEDATIDARTYDSFKLMAGDVTTYTVNTLTMKDGATATLSYNNGNKKNLTGLTVSSLVGNNVKLVVDANQSLTLNGLSSGSSINSITVDGTLTLGKDVQGLNNFTFGANGKIGGTYNLGQSFNGSLSVTLTATETINSELELGNYTQKLTGDNAQIWNAERIKGATLTVGDKVMAGGLIYSYGENYYRSVTWSGGVASFLDEDIITLEAGEGYLVSNIVANGQSGYHKVDGLSAIITAPIPEPSAFGLLAGLGALALVASRRRRK